MECERIDFVRGCKLLGTLQMGAQVARQVGCIGRQGAGDVVVALQRRCAGRRIDLDDSADGRRDPGNSLITKHSSIGTNDDVLNVVCTRNQTSGDLSQITLRRVWVDR